MITAYKQPHNEMHEWIKRRTKEMKPSALIPVVGAEAALNRIIIVTKSTISLKLGHETDEAQLGFWYYSSQKSKNKREESIFVRNDLSYFLIFFVFH
jgi:hypothetical protein